jgi:GT2 family glycosyltransferase
MPAFDGTAQANLRTGIIVPVYGRHDLTAAVLSDLARERAAFDVWFVDNQGDFDTEGRSVEVLTPNRNLGWAGGCNYGVSVRSRCSGTEAMAYSYS